MQKNTHHFLIIVGLMLTFGLTTTFANTNDEKTKKPKNSGVLSVKTTPAPYPVKVNGRVIGMSGVAAPTEFYLEPGLHRVEIEGPNGQTFSKELEIRKGAKNCICLKIVEQSISRPCPYDIQLDGPDKVLEGDLITFAAFNAAGASATPIKYRWKVTPETATITSGLGTPAITVDTKNLGGQTVRAELDVWDDVYDANCRQQIAVPTEVEKQKVPEAAQVDTFQSKTFDDDKARFDNAVIALQNSPEAQLYIILHPAAVQAGKAQNSYEKLSKRTLDYIVKTRGADPSRVSIVRGESRPQTTYEIWIVPPGAPTPVSQ